jgi:hypothetical protein
MTTTSIPTGKAKEGVKVLTNRNTTIQIETASIEILVGGPYTDHPYGHTALRVITKEGEKIYDYGRYGRVWGLGNSEGDGVLNIWTNFGIYIAGENALNRQTTGFLYEVPYSKAIEINGFFDKKTAGKKPRNSSKSKTSFIIEPYFALGPNCTTLSVEAAKVALPDLDRDWKKYQEGRGLTMFERGIVSTKGWPGFVFMPADLLAMLNAAAPRKPKAVRIYGQKK